ncbi:MAG: DNA gyrase subunit A [Anaerolineae bacterium]
MPERVTTVGIENEMRESYLDYAMSVIVSRALPDARDGLKPVQRRIIYAMGEMGLWQDAAYKKSARIVGEVLGKYHPHGDMAVYEAMVRMAQDFSLRYPLVDGQGNFGSVDGDEAAAMRYTEARLSAIAREMLQDIDKETVSFVSNFDESLREPEVLPARLPNLLINGSSGIAVGMATSIPPHNLSEVCDALIYLLDNYKRVEDIGTEHLMRFIQGPDFPTGGILYAGNGDTDSSDSLSRAYASGRGQVGVRAKVTTEEGSRGSTRLVVSELPYQTNKARLVERIAELVRAGRLDGVADVRDESDRQGMRLVIEVNKSADPRHVLAELYRLTPMQSTFSIIMLALVNGEPRTLSLKRFLLAYIDHRLEVIRRRSEFDLARAREREHILAGLLVALDHIDEVISIIRRSKTADTARTNLRRAFSLSERQAQAVLDMPLRRLASLERQRVEEEHEQCLATIADLESVLADPGKMRGIIRDEVLALRKQYGDARRTQIVNARPDGQTLTTADLVPDRPVVVLTDGQGRISRLPLGKRLRVNRGTRTLVRASLKDRLALFTDGGRCLLIPAHSLPEGQPGDADKLAEAFGAGAKERIAGLLVVNSAVNEPSILLATAAGKVKRIALDGLGQSWTQVIRLDEGDELVAVSLVKEGDAVVLASSSGQAISFAADEVRVAGLPAGSVAGMRLSEGEQLVSACALAGQHIVVLTEQGYMKRLTLKAWPSQKRGGSGVVVAGVDGKTGKVAGIACLGEGEKVFVAGSLGTAELLAPELIPVMGRPSKGKALLQLKAGEKAVALSKIALEV